MPGSSGTYHINVCKSVAEPTCKQGSVCLMSSTGGPVSSFGNSKAMTMDYKHEEQEVQMKYGGGDPCLTGGWIGMKGRRLRKRRSLSYSSLVNMVLLSSDQQWRPVRVPLHHHEQIVQRLHHRRPDRRREVVRHHSQLQCRQEVGSLQPK